MASEKKVCTCEKNKEVEGKKMMERMRKERGRERKSHAIARLPST